MVRPKLVDLKQEIQKYIGIPYFINSRHLAADNVYVGKGTAKEIALKTVEIANLENVKLLELSPKKIYNFQKKHHLGIDCSGLACHLLNFYFGTSLDVRKTSADMLTSPPLSKKIPITKIDTGSLIRQKNGHHVLFVIEVIDETVIYVHSGLSNKAVAYGEFNLKKPEIEIDGVYNLLLLN